MAGGYAGGVGYGGGGVGVRQGGDPALAGILSGTARVSRYLGAVSGDRISETLNTATRLLEGRPETIAARGVEFWMETVTVAALARVFNDEEPLGYEELAHFMEDWIRFVNFWNDP
jgi:hypothetical protein